jgi:hypothetical protein
MFSFIFLKIVAIRVYCYLSNIISYIKSYLLIKKYNFLEKKIFIFIRKVRNHTKKIKKKGWKLK